MKNILLLFVILFCFQSKAWTQETIPKFRLELSNQSIFTQGSYLVHAADTDFLIIEKKYNSANHLSGFWRLWSQIELGLGLGYPSRNAYVRKSFCFNLPCRGSDWVEEVLDTKLKSFEIPLELRWKFLKSAKRLIPYFSIGIVNRIPFFNPTLNGESKTGLSLKDYLIGGTLGAGLQFNFFEKWSLIFAAQIRKDRNFKLAEKRYECRWINEVAIKLGAGRSF